MTHLSNKMHSSEFSTDVLLAKWRAQETMVQKEKSRQRSEDTKNNNREADNVLEEKRRMWK